MKISKLLILIILLFVQLVNLKSEDFTKKVDVSSCEPPNIGIVTEIVKEKLSVKIGEKALLRLKIKALKDVRNITISYASTNGINIESPNNLEIAELDSGTVTLVPLSVLILKKDYQRIQIKINGNISNIKPNQNDSFITIEEIGFFYDKEVNDFLMKDSYEIMTDSYKIWNLITQDKLISKGAKIVFGDKKNDRLFIQAKPLESKVKRRKSLNHEALFNEISYEDTLIINSKNTPPNSINSVQSICVNLIGNCYYQDSDGQFVPLQNATISIWEDDLMFEDLLASTITDQNGHFSIQVCDNDGLFDSHLELYAQILTINDRVGVLNYHAPSNRGFEPFAWNTWTVETGGGSVDYGNLFISGEAMNRSGAKIFDNMQKAWYSSVNKGFNPSYTPIVFPSPTSECGDPNSSCYSYQTLPWAELGVIYMKSGSWLNGYEYISYHEYGHALMHRAYSNKWYPSSGGGNHLDFPQPAGFSWKEGWATFYTQVVQNDGYYRLWSDLENKNYIPYSTVTGEASEWRVAQALLDLYDTNSDGNDQISLPFNKFVSTMNANNSSSLTEFWGHLKNILTSEERYSGSLGLIYNTIPVLQEPVPTVPPIISSLVLTPNPVCKGSYGYVKCNLSQGNGNLSYSWTATNLPSGAYIVPMGSQCKVVYSDNTAAKENGGNQLMADLNQIKCTVSNSAGISTKSMAPSFTTNCDFGCPTLAFENNGIIENDNPILAKSVLSQSDVTDFYLIRKEVKNFDGKIKFLIHEPEEEHTYLDQVELFEVKVNPNEFITVSEEGNIINYKLSNSNLKILLNGKKDVIEDLSSLDKKSIRFNAGDTLIISSEQVANQQEGDELYFLLAGELPPVKTFSTANLIVNNINASESQPENSEIYLRSNSSYVAIKLGKNIRDDIKLQFLQDATIDYISVINNLKSAKPNKLKMVSAVFNGSEDVTEPLTNEDKKYSEIHPEEKITFTFESKNNSKEKTAYILKTVGRYEEVGFNDEDDQLQSDDNPNDLSETKLFGNYPNPFNPTTSIQYQLTEPGFVTLKVYNMLGQTVAELVNEMKEPGKYSVTFDASSLSSGTYIYEIKVNNFRKTQKMMLVK